MIPNKRTLTLKSKFGFGEHFDKTIEHLINLNKKYYIAWVYYNNDIIDYNQEIKDLIGLTKEHEISKPGRNPEYYDNHKNLFYEKHNDVTKNISEISMEKQKVFRKAAVKNASRVNKLDLARKNQGKI
jgi:hypothetical protein